MSQISIRGIDPKIEEEIRKQAREKGKSLNRVILDMLQSNTEKKKKPKSGCNSLKQLAGGWNDEDAEQFMESMNVFEQIDEKMWK